MYFKDKDTFLWLTDETSTISLQCIQIVKHVNCGKSISKYKIPLLSIWKWCFYLSLHSSFLILIEFYFPSFFSPLLSKSPQVVCSVLKFLDIFRVCVCVCVCVRALLCFHSLLSAYVAKLIWWEEENSGNHRGPFRAPHQDWSSASSTDTYLSCLQPFTVSHTHTHTHTEINTLVQNRPSIHLLTFTSIQSFSQVRSNRQTKRKTYYFSDTHLPYLLISPVCVCVCVCVPKIHMNTT